MVGNVVSRRYAKALVGIVKKENRLDETQKELTDVNDIINGSGDSKLSKFLNNPAMGMNIKQEVLETIIQRAGVSEVTNKFLHLLLEKDRFRYIETILFFYEELSYQIQNRLKVKIVSASPLTEEHQGEITGKLSEITGKQVELTLATDADLIGGLVAQVGSTIYDGSLKNQLSMIKEELMDAK